MQAPEKPKKRKIPPGASPYLQGYWSYVWCLERKPPEWHENHDEQFRLDWLRGYDDARLHDGIRQTKTR